MGSLSNDYESGSATDVSALLTTSDFDSKTGSLTETAPATDTASSGLNGRLQRIAQRLTSLITAIGNPFQAGGSIGNTSFASTVADGANVTLGAKADAKSTATDTTPISAISVLKQISASVQAPPTQAVTFTGSTDAATQTTLATRLSESDFDTKTGSLTETAPATDTASSGLNGRLQRVAQRLTSLITALGSPFQAGGSIGNTTFASTQSGTWTVQPGNTANTTAWKVDGSAVTQPVSMATNTPVGTIAHDSADSGAPIKFGGRARSSEIGAVTSDDRVDAIFDLVGKQIVLPYANPENFVSGTITSAMTGTTSTSLMAAPASGLRNYITSITVSNASTTVPTDILVQDGSGGTTLYVLPCPIGTGTGTGTSGATFTFPTPLRQPTTATAIFVANVTTGSSTKVSASGYKGI
jgi:hypothetical protein